VAAHTVSRWTCLPLTFAFPYLQVCQISSCFKLMAPSGIEPKPNSIELSVRMLFITNPTLLLQSRAHTLSSESEDIASRFYAVGLFGIKLLCISVLSTLSHSQCVCISGSITPPVLLDYTILPCALNTHLHGCLARCPQYSTIVLNNKNGLCHPQDEMMPMQDRSYNFGLCDQQSWALLQVLLQPILYSCYQQTADDRHDQ
jgi:hypothetical protein